MSFSETYKYLGFVFHENMKFCTGKRVLSDSAGRALGAVINKMKVCPDLSFTTYSQLFDSMVAPILFYAAGVWGYEEAIECNSVQNRAMRYFLGVHKFTPRAAIEGEMGWEPCVVKQTVEVLRLWNRLVSLPEGRLTKMVFNWDKIHEYPWTRDVFDIFKNMHSLSLFSNNLQCKIHDQRKILFDIYKEKWHLELFSKPKLRTYILLKDCFSVEQYVSCHLKRGQRSLCAQLRAGVLPLELEVGRYKGVPEDKRLCKVCDLSLIEDEFHFMFYCPLYVNLRTVLFAKIQSMNPDLFWLSEGEMLKWLFKYDFFFGCKIY